MITEIYRNKKDLRRFMYVFFLRLQCFLLEEEEEKECPRFFHLYFFFFFFFVTQSQHEIS